MIRPIRKYLLMGLWWNGLSPTEQSFLVVFFYSLTMLIILIDPSVHAL